MESSNDVLEQVQKLRDEKEKAETQLGQVQEMNLRYKEQSDRVQQSVTEKMGSIIQVRARRRSSLGTPVFASAPTPRTTS